MYEHHISKNLLISNFRQGAKDLIKVHAKDIQAKHAQGELSQEQYQQEMAQHRIFFGVELMDLFEKIMQSANHFPDHIKKVLEEELNVTYAKYREYYKTHYS